MYGKACGEGWKGFSGYEFTIRRSTDRIGLHGIGTFHSTDWTILLSHLFGFGTVTGSSYLGFSYFVCGTIMKAVQTPDVHP